MATSKWVYRLSDGQYLRGGFVDPTYDPATEAVDEFLDADPHPDVRLHKAPGRVPRTPAELAAWDARERQRERDEQLQASPILLAVVRWIAGRLGLSPGQAMIEVRATLDAILDEPHPGKGG